MILIVLWNGHQAWNWHLASFNRFSGGQDAHSTPIHCLIQQRLFFSFFPVPYSLLPAPYSLLPTPIKPMFTYQIETLYNSKYN
ncbi:MAG: hypothetical protein F6J90_23995 [Moorea sp. SIOASIH]|uniref:hypothetical protein n=1 Tax=Moorena sp. SIOASIH TaxID=2607817 RepID=UPI0013B6DDBA|nr:hypothetical protein [Moorena sp. SIOASIH]NEO39230.1 hypothetical protein [Moorena sp. SIOASIH]